MNILNDINESISLERLNGRSEEDVKNAFFANYMSALLLLKLQDLKGLLIINDPSHAKLTRFSSGMSDVNFWGKALFYPSDSQISSRMLNGHAKVLHKEAGRIVHSRIQAIMKLPLTSPENVNWGEAIAMLVLMRERFGITSTYFKHILYTLSKWDVVSQSAKQRAVNSAFMYLVQSDPRSALVSRMRALSTSSLLQGIANLAQKFIGFKKLAEDDGGGAMAITSSTSSIATGADSSNFAPDNAIAGGYAGGNGNMGKDCKPDLGNLFTLKTMSKHQVSKKGKYLFKDNKIIKKRRKKFKVQRYAAPDFMKLSEE